MVRIVRRLIVKYWRNRGLNNYVKGDFVGARKYFLKIDTRHHPEPGNVFNLGLVELGLGNFSLAEAYLVKAAVEDKSAPVTRTLADLYYIWGKQDQALAGYTKARAMASNPEDKALMQERIAICRSRQAYRQVRRSFALLEEGTAAMRREEVDLAQKAFLEAVDCDPTNYVALNNLGSLMLNERKEGRKALKWFQAAARLWDSPVVKNNLEQARRALKKEAD